MQRVVWDDEMLAALHRLRAAGVPISECARQVGVSYKLTQDKCREEGLSDRRNRGRKAAAAILQQASGREAN